MRTFEELDADQGVTIEELRRVLFDYARKGKTIDVEQVTRVVDRLDLTRNDCLHLMIGTQRGFRTQYGLRNTKAEFDYKRLHQHLDNKHPRHPSTDKTA